MLGASTFAESTFASLGGVVQIATAEMNALGTSSSVGSGTLVGVSSLSGNFTKTTAGIYITGSVNAEVSSNFVTSAVEIDVVNDIDATLSSVFTQTTEANHVRTSEPNLDLNFTKTTIGDILFEEVVTDATTEIYEVITPGNDETWTNITPENDETWTEINA